MPTTTAGDPTPGTNKPGPTTSHRSGPSRLPVPTAPASAGRTPNLPIPNRAAPTGADPGPPDRLLPDNIRPARLHPHALGQRGEDFAAGYLESQGLVILSRNWRCRLGELDLVATDGNALVVCEVKTRSSEDFGTPAEAVHPKKARSIRRATFEWLSRYGVRWCPVRFDVLAIIWPPNEPPQLEHLRGVFT